MEADAYMRYLENAVAILDKLRSVLQEDAESVGMDMNGELERKYIKYCGEMEKKLKELRTKIRILHSESSAG